jgi:hypothetical protein
MDGIIHVGMLAQASFEAFTDRFAGELDAHPPSGFHVTPMLTRERTAELTSSSVTPSSS